MSNLTIVDLLQTVLATGVFLLLMVPPGFLFGWTLDLMRFRSRSTTEQLLWTFALSTPLDLVVANVPGRFLPAYATLGFFALLDAAAVALAVRLLRQGRFARLELDRRAKLVVACLLGGVVYLWLAGMPLQIGNHLFEPAFASDWEIRLPLIRAAAQNGVPPHNPFFTFGQVSPPIRYYYYWFSVCAQVVRLAHTGARATLIASAVYSGLCAVATLFLCLKYMERPDGRLRQRCLLLLGLLLVLGLDVLPSLLGLALWHIRLRAEIEWWLPDRSPGLISAMLYAPHHVAGAACGLLQLLLLSSLLEEPEEPGRRRVVTVGIAVGIVFAGMVGTSTYITMFFGLTSAVLGVICLARRNLRLPAALVLAAVLSLAASIPYLHELTAKTVIAPGTPAGRHLLSFALRDREYARWTVIDLAYRLHRSPPWGRARHLWRGLVILACYLSETGFYLVAVAVQFWREFRSGRSTTPQAKVLWLLAGCVGFFFFAVTSAPVQIVNDLGVHAGLILRIVLMLWAAQVLAWYFAERHRRSWLPWQWRVIRLATVLLVLGLVSSAWQIVVERSYTMLLDAHWVPAAPPFPHARQLSRIYNDVHAAQARLGEILPEDAVIQSNPRGEYQTIFRLYQTRRQAAGDMSCEGAFGGDPALCRSFVLDLLKLFGTRPPMYLELPSVKATAADMSEQAMAALCSRVGIEAMLVSSADPVWYQPHSWVWRGNLLYSNAHVRVLRCPVS